MLFNNLRRLTPELLKNGPYHYNVLWNNHKYLFIRITEKSADPRKDIPDYDLDVNPYLIPPHNTTTTPHSSSSHL